MLDCINTSLLTEGKRMPVAGAPCANSKKAKLSDQVEHAFAHNFINGYFL